MRERPSETRLLLGRWHGCDRAALEAHLERDLAWIEGYVRRRLGRGLRPRLDVGDVVQEAMIAFLRRGPRCLQPDRARFRRLAARVVENVLGHQYKRFTAQRREMLRERPLPREDALDLDARRETAPTPSGEAHRREREASVHLALELLEPGDREVILLREWEQLSLAELGSRLGIREDAARMRHQRAVRRLARTVRQLRGRVARPDAVDAPPLLLGARTARGDGRSRS